MTKIKKSKGKIRELDPQGKQKISSAFPDEKQKGLIGQKIHWWIITWYSQKTVDCIAGFRIRQKQGREIMGSYRVSVVIENLILKGWSEQKRP